MKSAKHTHTIHTQTHFRHIESESSRPIRSGANGGGEDGGVNWVVHYMYIAGGWSLLQLQPAWCGVFVGVDVIGCIIFDICSYFTSLTIHSIRHSIEQHKVAHSSSTTTTTTAITTIITAMSIFKTAICFASNNSVVHKFAREFRFMLSISLSLPARPSSSFNEHFQTR